MTRWIEVQEWGANARRLHVRADTVDAVRVDSHAWQSSLSRGLIYVVQVQHAGTWYQVASEIEFRDDLQGAQALADGIIDTA